MLTVPMRVNLRESGAVALAVQQESIDPKCRARGIYVIHHLVHGISGEVDAIGREPTCAAIGGRAPVGDRPRAQQVADRGGQRLLKLRTREAFTAVDPAEADEDEVMVLAAPHRRTRALIGASWAAVEKENRQAGCGPECADADHGNGNQPRACDIAPLRNRQRAALGRYGVAVHARPH